MDEIDTSETRASSTLTAFFDTRADAEDAARRLREIGIADSAIRIVGDGSDASADTSLRADADKGFWESLSDFFFPDEDRAVYAEGLRRGGTLLTVSNIPAGLHNQTLDILDDEGSVDLDTRASDWRSEGWSDTTYGAASAPPLSGTSATDFAAGSSSATRLEGDAYRESADTYRESVTGSAATLRGDRDEEVIPVVEEQLRIGKRDVNLGRVRVRSYVVEEPVSESVNLRNERVFVERRPVDRALTGTEAAFTDRVIEAEEHAEEAVISKEARVKEEIALRREAEERSETVSDTVRRTEVEVEDERLEAERLSEAERRTANKL